MKNVKLYEEAYDRLTSFLSMEDDWDKEFARYLNKCNGDLEVLNLFVQTLEDTVLELHKLVYDVSEFKVLYADTFGILTCEYYDNRHKFNGAENVTYIDFLCNVWADLKLGKLNKQDATTLVLKLFGDELENLTDGVGKVDTFSLIIKDTQRLVDKVSDGLKDLQTHYDESNKRLEQIKGISLSIASGEVSKVKKDTITIINDDFSHVTKKEIWDEYNNFIDSVDKFEIMLDEMRNNYDTDSAEFKVLEKAIKLFDECVEL